MSFYNCLFWCFQVWGVKLRTILRTVPANHSLTAFHSSSKKRAITDHPSCAIASSCIKKYQNQKDWVPHLHFFAERNRFYLLDHLKTFFSTGSHHIATTLISGNGKLFPIFGVKIKNRRNHHLVSPNSKFHTSSGRGDIERMNFGASLGSTCTVVAPLRSLDAKQSSTGDDLKLGYQKNARSTILGHILLI